MTENPNTIHGRLMEAVHISGYGFERACSELEWLLEGERWKELGFKDGAEFAESIAGLFKPFRMSIEDRKPLSKKLTAIASQRAVAEVLGVNEVTVARDTGNTRGATNVVSKEEKPNENNANEGDNATNVAPEPHWTSDTDSNPAKIAKGRANKEANREQRLDKIAEISKGNTDIDTSQQYPIIYADPPWRYENSPVGGSNRSIENHYPTMTLEEICNLPVVNLATEDAMLYLWATAPKLAECMEVIDAWGFEYRTCMIWDKEHIGMGYHARNQHEILLIAKRGNIPPPKAGTQPSSMYSEKRGKHSAKPIFFYEMIENAYPKLPKIELFCRSPRDGWAVWGNQSDDT